MGKRKKDAFGLKDWNAWYSKDGLSHIKLLVWYKAKSTDTPDARQFLKDNKLNHGWFLFKKELKDQYFLAIFWFSWTLVTLVSFGLGVALEAPFIVSLAKGLLGFWALSTAFVGWLVGKAAKKRL